MTISRRSLLLRLLPAVGVLTAACGDDDPLIRITAADDRLMAASTSPPVARAAPQSSGMPVLSLPGTPIPQGGSFSAQLTGDRLVNVSVEYLGHQFPTLEEHGTHLTVLPVGQAIGTTEQVPPGTHSVIASYEIIGSPLPRALEGSVTVTPTEFPVESLSFTPEVAALLEPSRAEQEAVLLEAAYGGFTPERLWDGFFLRPSAAEISDVYGSRRSYQGGPPAGSHAGVDFGAAAGDPVFAAANGRVVQAQMMPVRGNMVILDHGAGVFTGYCHLTSFAVQPGQEVRAGDLIAATGTTGLSTGPHLHWEVAVGGMQVDGLRWLQV
ncbi:MAG: M23 family metallopeptidase [Dehalococcoidia bacterium]